MDEKEWSDIFRTLSLPLKTFECEEDPLIPTPYSEGKWRYGILPSGDLLFGIKVSGTDITRASITIGGQFTYTKMSATHTNDMVMKLPVPVPMFRLRTVAVNLNVHAKRITCVRSVFGSIHEDSRHDVVTHVRNIPRLIYRHEDNMVIL